MAISNFSEFQSAYRIGHSTETVLLQVVNDIVRATCDQKTTALLALDISAAFDSIDLNILLERCRKDFGVKGIALNCLTSFITCRIRLVYHKVAYSDHFCLPFTFHRLVILFTAHRLRYQQYAYDTQVYMALRPGSSPTFDALSRCVNDVYRWFLENGRMLNSSKTEAVLFDTQVQRASRYCNRC